MGDTPTSDDLLPCPFCGGEAVILPYAVVCNNCGAKIETIYKYRMFSAWNTRAAPRWIPMTERKPKDGQIVAIFKPDALENDDEYETVEWNVRYNDLDISRHLWYPLPEPPKEVEG